MQLMRKALPGISPWPCDMLLRRGSLMDHRQLRPQGSQAAGEIPNYPTVHQ